MNKLLVFHIKSGVLAILVSILYHMNLWFTFEFLGPEIGSQRESVQLWANINMALGVLVVILAIWQIIKPNPIITKSLLATTNILLFINMLPLFLWSFFAGSSEGLRAALLHLILCMFSFIGIWGLLRYLGKQVGKNSKYETDG